MGRPPATQKFDAAWRAWIDRQYGDPAKAEAAWQFAAPREDGEVAGPADDQIVQDGPCARWCSTIASFQNELLDSAYRRARDLVRSVDQNHLVSFRMTIAGDPTTSPARMAYDPAGLAGAVDIMEPEGYGRIGDWNQVRPGWFTVAYCRAVAPELPVLWAEFGYSVWDPASAAPARTGSNLPAVSTTTSFAWPTKAAPTAPSAGTPAADIASTKSPTTESSAPTVPGVPKPMPCTAGPAQ